MDEHRTRFSIQNWECPSGLCLVMKAWEILGAMLALSPFWKNKETDSEVQTHSPRTHWWHSLSSLNLIWVLSVLYKCLMLYIPTNHHSDSNWSEIHQVLYQPKHLTPLQLSHVALQILSNSQQCHPFPWSLIKLMQNINMLILRIHTSRISQS